MEQKKVAIAVNWWADKLQACKHSGLSAEERRDPANEGYQLAEMLMTLAKPKVTSDQIENFKENLTAALLNSNPRILSTDYEPDRILRECLMAARIDPGMGTLPIKTVMWLDDDQIQVRYGYGAEIETLRGD